MGFKLKIDIERLLTWALVEELPKQTVGGLTGWERLTFLGTTVDESDREQGMPVGAGPPHPDALIVSHAIGLLDDIRFSWRELRAHLMGHLAPYVSESDPACASMHFESAALVRVHAILQKRPVWNVGPVTLTRIREKNGKPRVQYLDDEGHLVNGLTSGKRYGAMSRCPLQLEPPAAEIACARAEYLVWRVALVEVTRTLAGWGLRDHEVTGPAAPEQPWRNPNKPKPRVLPALQETVNHNRMSRVTPAC